VWDCRFAACGTYGEHFSGFEFFLLPGRVHARRSALLINNKDEL
jgi:hypothetical protein